MVKLTGFANRIWLSRPPRCHRLAAMKAWLASVLWLLSWSFAWANGFHDAAYLNGLGWQK